MKKIIIVSLGVCVLSLLFLQNNDEKSIKYCMEQGYSKTICERGLYGTY